MGFPCVVASITFGMELGARVTVQASFIYVKYLTELRFFRFIKVFGPAVGFNGYILTIWLYINKIIAIVVTTAAE